MWTIEIKSKEILLPVLPDQTAKVTFNFFNIILKSEMTACFNGKLKCNGSIKLDFERATVQRKVYS